MGCGSGLGAGKGLSKDARETDPTPKLYPYEAGLPPPCTSFEVEPLLMPAVVEIGESLVLADALPDAIDWFDCPLCSLFIFRSGPLAFLFALFPFTTVLPYGFKPPPPLSEPPCPDDDFLELAKDIGPDTMGFDVDEEAASEDVNVDVDVAKRA